MTKVETKFVKISELELLEGNPRRISQANFERLCDSIKKNPEYFWARPILANNKSGKNIVYAGNQRLKAATANGMKEVPCIIETLDTEQERERTIRDNVELGEWDYEILANEWDLDELTDMGVKIPDVEILPKEGEKDPDEVPDVQKKSKSVLGDLYEIGEHRVLCGSSTVQSDIDKLMGGRQADCVWTDPPYNVDYEGAGGQKIQNDNMGNDAFKQFLTDAFMCAFTVTKEGGCIYVAHADSEGINFRTSMKDAGFDQKQTLIWVKNAPVLGRQDYNWQHEPILYGWKPGAAHFFCLDFTQKTVIDGDTDLKKLGKPELMKIINDFRNAEKTSVARVAKPSKSDDHPTMKPVDLVRLFVNNSTRPGEIVLDLFLGSASTMVAAHQIQRKCYGMELDEKYVDVCVRRMLNFDSSLTLKLNGKEIDRDKWLNE